MSTATVGARVPRGRTIFIAPKCTARRRILVAGMGTSPAVLTETVYCDEKKRKRQSLEEMCTAVEDVVECLYKEQWELFEKKVSEWPISFQFYYYMRTKLSYKFQGYQMDGEYNHRTKGFNQEAWKKEISCNGRTLSVRPDFLIHRRSPDSKKDKESPRNFLWVEIKRHGGKWLEDDRKKLCAVTSKMNEDLKKVSDYEVGLSLLLLKKHVHCEWFQSGRKVKYRVGKICTRTHSIEWEDITV